MTKPSHPSSTRRPVVLANRFRIERGLDGDRHEATDTARGGTVIVTRVPFGAERAEERDQMIERVRALWAVTAPSLVLPIDTGTWDEDAYVVEERVDAPSASLASGLQGLDAHERASVAKNVADAVAALHAAGFVHGTLTLDGILLDGYRQPKIHTAVVATRASTGSERVEDRTLRILLEAISPGVTKAARQDATAAELARSIGTAGPGPSRPLVNVGSGRPDTQRFMVLALILTLAAIALMGFFVSRM